MRSGTGTKGDDRRVESEGLSPEMVMRDGMFDKGTTGSANMWFDRRRKVFAFPGAEDLKGERLCPNPDRRRRSFSQVFQVGFRYGWEIGIILSSSDEGSCAGFDLAEKSRTRLGLSQVNGETVEVEKWLVEGVDVVLVVDIRVEVGGPFQRRGGRPGGRKAD